MSALRILTSVCMVFSSAFMPSGGDVGEPMVRVADRLEYARSLPLEQRLDFYEEIYGQSGHPQDSSLSFAFENEGEAGFQAAALRMTSRSRFYGMIWVVKAIDQAGGIDACSYNHAEVLRDRAIALRMSQRDLMYITFRNCDLESLY